MHTAHSRRARPEDFLQDLLAILARYHPRAMSLNSQGRKLKLTNHWGIPPPLTQALEAAFLATTEFVGSPSTALRYYVLLSLPGGRDLWISLQLLSLPMGQLMHYQSEIRTGGHA